MRRAPLAPTLTALTLPLLLIGLSFPGGARAWSNDPTGGAPVCTAPGLQSISATVPDGAGGLIVTWADVRGADQDIYAMRLTKAGQPYPGWTIDGVPVCVLAGVQVIPVLVSDGAGGAIIAWQDSRSGNADIYAQHITGSGAVAPGWPANGLVVGAAAPAGVAREELAPAIASDGSGGAFVVWTLVYTASTDLDVYGNHVTGAGAIVSGWSPTGSGIDGNGAVQNLPAVCPDGAGGLIVAYQDNFNGNYDIHAQHLTADHAVVANNFVDARAGDQDGAVVRSDGAGGAFITYSSATSYLALLHISGAMQSVGGWGPELIDYNSLGYEEYAGDIVSDGSGGVYVSSAKSTGFYLTLGVQHVLADASIAPGWPVSGVNLPESYSTLSYVTGSLVPDAAGGVIAVYPTSPGHIFAIRYLSNGTVANGWPSGGASVCTANGGQFDPLAVTDGSGGALSVWMDYRNGNYDLYANRIEHFGKLGNPEPVLAGVKDVRNDQGGQVRVSWLPSYLDADPTYGIYAYYLFRQAPASAALAAVRRGGARLVSAADFADAVATVTRDVPRYLVTQEDAQTYYWEQVATVQANELPGYSVVAATTGDSTASGNPYTLFMVDALGNGGGYWFSAPDSGYSVDDLAPAMPTPFTGTYVLGSGAFLNWGPNAEPDLAGYRLYRGDSPGFVPGPSNLVVAQAITGYTDAGALPAVYKLCAVDVHGNESPFAYLMPAGVADAPGAQVPREVFLARIEPNPARGGTTLRFGLPREGAAELALFDTQGRRVRALAAGTRAAGEYTVRWDGLDEGGRAVGSGVYFVRLSAEGRVFTQRLVRVE